MVDQPLDIPAGGLKGRAVEQAAVAWVMEYERRNGRSPVDRRYERKFAGDIESPPRIIEIKATATSYRGWFLPLEPIQLEHAMSDENFFIYVVEKVGQGDPALFTLRTLTGDQLRALAVKAVGRHYFDMSWPTKVYDSIPSETMPAGEMARTDPPSRPLLSDPAVSRPPNVSSARDAIRAAFEQLGGERSPADVNAWIHARYPGRWKDVSTLMADATFPGNNSSPYSDEQRFLERVAPGLYRLRVGGQPRR